MSTLDYDHYYASLAASASVSAQATPSGMSAPGSSDFDDFGNDDEDHKPSVEYLDSLNDYRKRSRSKENEGGAGRFKVPKVEEPQPLLTNGTGHGITNGVVNGDAPQPMVVDDPLVMGTIFLLCLVDGFVDGFLCSERRADTVLYGDGGAPRADDIG